MKSALVIFCALVLTGSAGAQQQQPPGADRSGLQPGGLMVKTVPLHYLSSEVAVTLLNPYRQSSGGGVFEVSNVHAITIKETPKVFADMMALLAQYDREPANVTLNFQLIAADASGRRDPAIAGVDSLLRGVLKYTGYHLLGTAMATASERSVATQTLAAESEILTIHAVVGDVRVDGNDASVHVSVQLNRPMTAQSNGKAFQPNILSTDVTVPVGQTVVLGTAASAVGPSGTRALILTIRPQLASPKR